MEAVRKSLEVETKKAVDAALKPKQLAEEVGRWVDGWVFGWVV